MDLHSKLREYMEILKNDAKQKRAQTDNLPHVNSTFEMYLQ